MPFAAMSTRFRVSQRRDGFTIIEFLIVVVILGVVMAITATAFRKQQRFVTKTTSLVGVRAQVRQAAAVLPAELRAVSSVGGDIYAMTARTIDFRGSTGGSMVCQIPAVGAADLVIPPHGDLSRGRLTWWLRRPEAGDSVFVYDEGLAVGNFDDTWRRYEVTAVTPVTGINGCPLASRYVTAADTAQPSYRIRLSGNLPASTPIGAGVRFFRRTAYRLYQEADQQWYLGFADCLRTRGCSSFEPVSGPYRPFSTATGESGLLMSYLDSLGNATAAPAEVARVELFLSGKTGVANSPVGLEESVDSLSLTVGLRNRT
jgi:prepilin-type N-terminal cleavage/methylation domain-containing protein